MQEGKKWNSVWRSHGGKPYTTEDFISASKDIYGDFFDYSKTEYKGYTEPITLICPEHGEFITTPREHTRTARGSGGCTKCSREKQARSKRAHFGLKNFLQKSRKIHGNFYNYDKVVYVGMKEYVTIICPIHGEFKQRASNHMAGHGCKQCGVIKCVESRKLNGE